MSLTDRLLPGRHLQVNVTLGSSQERAVLISGVFVLSVLLLVSTIPIAAAHSQPGNSPPLQQTTPTPSSTANNSTVQHERPSNVSERGNTEALQQWLVGRLTNRLNDSAVAVSQSEYQRGREVLGSDFESQLEQYVDVAGDTDGTTDDQTAEQIREARTQQQSYADAVATYETTYERYQQARENGNTTAARQYARELTNQSVRINELNQSVVETYEDLEASGITVGQAPTAISNVSNRVAAQQAQVQSQTFRATRLQITTNQTAVSFTNPLPVTGRLTTTNGTPVANQSIQLQVFEREYSTTTGSNGSFTVQYRPVALPVNATTITVSYVPGATSPYLGNDTTVPVRVRQVTPSLSLTVSNSSVQYGDRLTVYANVTVSNRSVPSLPVSATLAGQTVTRTTERGTVRLTRRIPASLTAGNQSLLVAHTREGLAIAPVTATVPLSVVQTLTELSVRSTASAQQVTVRGRLRTTAGNGVSAQPVTITIGETVVTTTTNETGWYRRTVNATEVATNTSTTPITVEFDGRGTNLGASQATTTVSLPQTVDDVSERWSSELLIVLFGGVLLTGLLAAIAWRRRRSDDTVAAPRNDTSSDSPRAASSDTSLNRADQWLALAEDHLSATTDTDPNRAVVAAYAALRASFADQIDNAETLTHREFRAACSSHLDTDDETALETVIQGYEQATFAQTLTTVHADDVVAAATTLIEPGN